jgi:hypothetical protein
VPTNRRLPTLRSTASSLSSISDGPPDINDDNPQHQVLTRSFIDDRINAMVDRAKNGIPLTDDETEDVINGLKNLIPNDAPINFDEVTSILKEVAHLSHKDWGVTSCNSDKLLESLSIASDSGGNTESGGEESNYPLSSHARHLLQRILKDGNWDGAVEYTKTARPTGQCPWAVLVTGVNGIRKTTSMYQPWFAQLLQEAIIPPTTTKSPSTSSSKKQKSVDHSLSLECLPTGSNSFFRQLDHMICTLCNEEFSRLYTWAASELPKHDLSKGDPVPVPSEDVVEKYSDYKAAIFTRYRTLSELLGALLLKQAQLVDINCMMETSGRDVAMFHYVDHFFDNERSNYKKLALHFTINDLACAMQSVDRRMIQEIQAGAKAVETGDPFDVVYTNEGGPYGSKVLEGVQKDSDKVWEEQVLVGAVGKDWYKATIAIEAHPTEPWTAQAVRPDGSLGTKFTFERKP